MTTCRDNFELMISDGKKFYISLLPKKICVPISFVYLSHLSLIDNLLNYDSLWGERGKKEKLNVIYDKWSGL
jgi:hypothetical protein